MALEINKKKSPHLAMTHEIQGGASNGRNLSLLMKADAEIDEDTAKLIEKVSGVKVQVTKASYEALREKLSEAVKKFESKEYDWTWVVDFDESTVVFSNNSGIFYTTYTVTGLEVEVGNEATEVSRVVSYVEGENKVVLSDSLEGIDSGVRSLIVKSFDSISKNEKLVDVFKSKKGNQMQVEIEKAVDEATKVLKADLENAQALLKEAQEQVASYEKAAQEQKEAFRKAAISEAVSDEAQVEALLKSTAVLDDESFSTVVASLKAKAEVVENSDLFQKTSDSAPIEKADEVPMHVQILQKQFGVKQ